LITIVFFILKRKLSTLNHQELNPQENNFLLEAEGNINYILFKIKERRKAKIEEERKKKHEEDLFKKEKDKKIISDNIINEANISNLNLNSETKIIERNITDNKLLDKIKNLDSDFLKNQAYNILNKEKLLAEKKGEENLDNINFFDNNNFSNNKYNNNSNYYENSNENADSGSSLLMKKIVLLEPETKIKKDDSADISNEGTTIKTLVLKN